MFRIGFGYDAHRLGGSPPLILGGAEIPSEEGLEGHSDADVLLHAVIDAVIGAVGEGDIGRHFPDTDQAYKGVSSLWMLEKVLAMVRERGYGVGNVDATIVAQRPRLAPFIPIMRENLAGVCEVPEARINIKATTTEGLGPSGRREGMEAYAVVSILSREVMGDSQAL